MGFIRKVFGSRKPPPVPQLPPQPAPVELMDVIDELSGTQTVTVNLPNGKKQRVTQRLPRTPQEDAMFKKAEDLMSQAVTNIEALYKYDPASVANYQPFIQAFSQINDERAADLAQIGNFADIGQKVASFRQLNKELVTRELDRQDRMSEEVLAKRGLGRSTAAAEERAARAGQRALVEQQGLINAELYGDDLMRKQLALQGDLYSMREAGRAGRLQEVQTGYELERQKQADLEALRQGAVVENQNLLATGAGIKQGDMNKSQLALQYNNSAINLAHQQAVDQNQRYAAQTNAIRNQYAMDMDRFRATPARFSEKLIDTGLSAAGQAVPAMFGMPSFGAAAQPTAPLQKLSARG